MEKGEKPLWQQDWFWPMVAALVAAAGLVAYLLIQFNVPDKVMRAIRGPSIAEEAQQRALWEQAWQDWEKAKETGDISILQRRWCGDALERVKHWVEGEDMQRLRVVEVDYGLGYPAPMSVREHWRRGTTEIAFTFKVGMGRCGCSERPSEEIPEFPGCIVELYPTIIVPPEWDPYMEIPLIAPYIEVIEVLPEPIF